MSDDSLALIKAALGGGGAQYEPPPSWHDPDFTMYEKLLDIARILLEGLIAEELLETVSSYGARALTKGAARALNRGTTHEERAAIFAEWLLEEEEVGELSADDETLAARLRMLMPDPPEGEDDEGEDDELEDGEDEELGELPDLPE
ncbi:hypothetical protein G6O69_04970 [Pseudenhygromyxa sp. WMMC2535]|uniref:hypothetical protein n=1 Tax=Pseudenhygromyxa sp. WMMC2535 TaxID=2712867 RepID=UPI0015551E10|nr:hypothetical protein [Pseudenhygromyxa sp. WMMC2535]NVB37172.1 hypothetical protein [Pseudenhygromyxa sp. WMMC2535]